MSRGAEIELNFPDQPRIFALKIGQLRLLQEKCGAGPMAVLRRLSSGDWLVDDVIETLRLGLIGGGVKLEEAVKLRAEIEQRPLGEAVPAAIVVLSAALVGPPDEAFDDTGQGDDAEKMQARGTGSASSTSTATEPSSAGPPPPSIN
jgi:hypothetical protein